jgi:hypothetical protein
MKIKDFFEKVARNATYASSIQQSMITKLYPIMITLLLNSTVSKMEIVLKETKGGGDE